MSYLYNDNCDIDHLPFEILNNNKNIDDKISEMLCEFNKKNNEESFSNSHSHYFINSTSPKTDKGRQDELNNLNNNNININNNVLIKELNNGLTIKNEVNNKNIINEGNKKEENKKKKKKNYGRRKKSR